MGMALASSGFVSLKDSAISTGVMPMTYYDTGSFKRFGRERQRSARTVSDRGVGTSLENSLIVCVSGRMVSIA